MTARKNSIPNGFRLDLEHYCTDCPLFKARTDVLEVESGNYAQSDKLYYTLTCERIESCRSIYQSFLEKERKEKV